MATKAGNRSAKLDSEVEQLKRKVAKLQAALKEFKRKRGPSEEPPKLPGPNARGLYPARETLRVLVAREVVERRKKAGLTQAELAALAGVRQETLSRLESGKHAPNVRTVDRIDKALKEAGV